MEQTFRSDCHPDKITVTHLHGCGYLLFLVAQNENCLFLYGTSHLMRPSSCPESPSYQSSDFLCVYAKDSLGLILLTL